MKILFIFTLIVPLFLASCGKTEEIKIIANPPIVEKQITITPPIVENPIIITGSTNDTNTKQIEEVSTGVVSESN